MKVLQASSLLALTAYAFLCASGAGAAVVAEQEPHMNVRLSDLNLSELEDVAKLYGRLRRAARMVCSDASGSWDARRTTNLIRCYNDALAQAVLRINQPLLTDLHGRMTSRKEG